MEKRTLKHNIILGILFFLPVIFLLFLYPAQHHYNALDIVKSNVIDLNNFESSTGEKILLEEHITVLGFLGKAPMEQVIAASNVKELIYDKFKGFKKFQVVMVAPFGSEDEAELLKKEIISYDELDYWHFLFAEEDDISALYDSLQSDTKLDGSLVSQQIFIIDKELNQRGRLDDRSDNELAKNKPIYSLISYNCIEVAEIKNKMSEDIRILFTEYRQKRKGKFDSTTRRAEDLNTAHGEQEN